VDCPESIVFHKTPKDSSVWKTAMFLSLGEGGNASNTGPSGKVVLVVGHLFNWGDGNRSNFSHYLFLFYTTSGESQADLNKLCSYKNCIKVNFN
jgi:hypothetical protein